MSFKPQIFPILYVYVILYAVVVRLTASLLSFDIRVINELHFFDGNMKHDDLMVLFL